MNFESGPPKQEEFNISTFRNRLKVIGGEVMVFGVTEDEAQKIQNFARESKGLELTRTDLSEGELKRHRIMDPSKKFGVVVGHTVDAHKALFDE